MFMSISVICVVFKCLFVSFVVQLYFVEALRFFIHEKLFFGAFRGRVTVFHLHRQGRISHSTEYRLPARCLSKKEDALVLIQGLHMKSTFRLSPLQGAIVLALASASPFSYALRLGEPVVKSYVGQPLVAEFAIEETSPEELRRLQISLANPSLYTNMRAAFHPALKTSSLLIVDRTSKTPKLVLRTDGPVEDSVVDIVFELTWAAGRMIQSSTVLIDPAPQGVAIDTPAFVPSPVVVVDSPKESTVNQSNFQAMAIPVVEASSPQTVVVQKGDTLSKIATRMNMQGVKLEQLLIALYNKNSKTIASKNINLIRQGTILALPTKQEALAVDASKAMGVVALHASNFRTYAQNLAQQSGNSTAVEKAPRSQKGSVSSEVVERQSGPVAEDQVRIGAGSEGKTKGGAVDKSVEIQQKHAEAENKSRQDAVEKNLKDLEALAKLKNEQLAKMQAAVVPAAAAPAASNAGLLPPPELNTQPVPKAPVSEPLGTQGMMKPAPAAVVKPEAILDEGKKVVDAKKPAPAASVPSTPIVETPTLPDSLRPNNSVVGPHEPEATKPTAEAVVAAPVAAVADTAKPAATPAPAIKEVKPISPPKVVTPPPQEESDDILPLAAGGAGLLALIGGWFYTRRKKKIDETDDYVEEVTPAEPSEKSFGFDFPDEQVENVAIQQPVAAEERSNLSDDELEAAAFLEELPATVQYAPDELVRRMTDEQLGVTSSSELSDMPLMEPVHIEEIPVDAIPFMPAGEEYVMDSHIPVDTAGVELPTFELNLNSNEDDSELNDLTRSLAIDMPSLEDPTPSSDTAAYPVSLTYDPDEQLGIANFYLGLQDYRGVWDMIHPLLNHERDDVRAKAQSLLSEIPDELRQEWTSEK